MSEQAGSTSSIYDLGYRNYDGIRLGRSHAVMAMYVHSLRACFGLGRRATAKIFPIALAIITLIPAVIQLGIASVADDIVDLYEADDYYGYVQTILALFCAAVAPEIVGRDQRNRTLSLYFSRAVTRLDYAVAKFLALTTALLLLTVGPQLILFFGNGMAGNDLDGYLRDEWQQLPSILLSGVLLSVMLAAISLAIASHVPQRAFATGAILGAFHISWVVADIIVSGIQAGGAANYTLLLSPFHIMRGFTLWFFNEDAGRFSANGIAGLPEPLYALAAVVFSAVCLYLVVRRYRTVAA